jgi:hypothetical protein
MPYVRISSTDRPKNNDHTRYAKAGINSRKELIGAGLALVVVALVLWGVAVAF